MTANNKPTPIAWIALALILLAVAVVVWISPTEKTMGEGIKVVYIHVALMWAGLLGLLIAGVLGAVILVNQNERWHSWAEAISWVGLAMFIAGTLISLLAAKINWGAVFLLEPRTMAGLRFSAFALIVKVIGGWLPWLRAKAGLNVLLALAVIWSTLNTPLVLHPKSPIASSDSLAIQATFIGLFGLVSLAGAWIVYHWQKIKSI